MVYLRVSGKISRKFCPEKLTKHPNRKLDRKVAGIEFSIIYTVNAHLLNEI